MCEWESLQEQYYFLQKNYSRLYKSSQEDKLRFQIFETNLELINKHNIRYEKGEVSYIMGINQFADLTDEEFTGTYLGYRKSDNEYNKHFAPSENYMAPDSIDWRSKGVVLSVKDQGNCGSSYAFSSVSKMNVFYGPPFFTYFISH